MINLPRTFPLDEFATVSNYAVDVDGILVEAALIEKSVARRVVQEGDNASRFLRYCVHFVCVFVAFIDDL